MLRARLVGLRWAIKLRNWLGGPAASTGDTSPLPLLESTLFWGAGGVAVTLVATYLGFATKDIRWFLVAAWPFCVLIALAISRRAGGNHSILGTFLGATIFGFLLFELSVYFPPPVGVDLGKQLQDGFRSLTGHIGGESSTTATSTVVAEKPRKSRTDAGRPPQDTPHDETDPDKELLTSAQKMQFNLCNFQMEWEKQWHDDHVEAAFGEKSGQPNMTRLHSLEAQHDSELSRRYADDYESDALDLRAKLIKEVPGIANQYARYDAVQSPNDIDSVYWDFHNLVLAFNSKISTGTYIHFVDLDSHPTRYCRPELGLQQFFTLPSGAYTPVQEPR
jgi:hypothetical protein